MTKAKRPRPISLPGYGIVNPYGGMWTVQIFKTAQEAQDHLERFWSGGQHGNVDLTTFKIVRAKQTTSYVGDDQ